MRFATLIAVAIVLVSGEDFAPIYSRSYASVYYQGSGSGTSGDGKKFNLPGNQQEELIPPEVEHNNEGTTELYYDDASPTSDPETATEPDSEQVHFVRMKINIGNKLKEDVELVEESEPTDIPESTDNVPDLDEQGIYYIYHPNGLLQRVAFTAKNDLQHMEYFAQFNYQNVEPIQEPVYFFDPNAYAFQRLELNYN